MCEDMKGVNQAHICRKILKMVAKTSAKTLRQVMLTMSMTSREARAAAVETVRKARLDSKESEMSRQGEGLVGCGNNFTFIPKEKRQQ